MCQIASVSLRERSIWATLGPRCLPRRFLVRWSLAVDGVLAGVQGGLEEAPAQIARAVLGDRAATVAGPGLDDARAQPGVAAELGRRGEPLDVADLRSDRKRVDPAEPGRGDQQRDVAMIGALVLELDGQPGDLQLEVIDQLQAASTLRRHGSGIASRSSNSRPARPNRSDTGHGWPKVISVAWMRFFSVVRWRTRCRRNRASSRSRRIEGSGSQIAGTRSRWESTARTRASILSVLHANGARPLTLCASATNTSQPRSSSESCTNRAPFIDSITARTG